MAASPTALRIYEPSYVDLLDVNVDAAAAKSALRAGFNGEANHVAVVKQTKWWTGGTAGEGARAAAAEDPAVSASDAQFPAKERQESARANGDLHDEVDDDEEEEEEEDSDEDGGDDLGSANDCLSVKSNESEHELRVLFAEVIEDESHYITTHEIQLSELDHDADCDVSACASWDGEDEHQVYTFVDYASFDREETIVEENEQEEEEEEEEEVVEEEEERARAKSDEAESAQPEIRRQSGGESGNAAGRVHVAIRATARAVNEPGGGRALKEERAREGAACLIAVPGRLHIGGGRLKGRDAHEHSSGTSSAVSELDDADKEVRNLTARAFRSLAYPYPYALSFSTSSESSASERGKGVGCWSALVDFKYGKKARPGEPAASARAQQPLGGGREGDRAAAAALWTRGGVRAPPVEVFALNGSLVSADGAAAACGDKLELVLRRARPAPDGMEDTHRRAALASSLLKSVLAKKVQFERERKMERGEIHEPEKAGKEKQRVREKDKERSESRRQSESDISLVCLDELAEVADGGGSARESPGEAKKGARGGALPRSQNSAFRSWRDGEFGFHEEREGSGSESSSGKATKMSRLFVPSIQLAGASRSSTAGEAGPRAITSKPPEIKISLRSARGDKSEPPLTVANALAAALRTEPSERVPHFTVRDVRDNSKGKLQAPIHQVRDVRKLVKSSYHFVSLEGNESKSADGEHKISKQSSLLKGNPASLSPIVIKCQSVNTNSSSKQSGNFSEPSKCKPAEDAPELDTSSPQVQKDDIKIGIFQVHKPPVQVTSANIKQEGSSGLKIETCKATRKQDKASDMDERKADTKMAALEKLQAAVKTMEQLYVFDKKEWKRKTEPQAIKDTHLLSLITSEEHGNSEGEQGDTGSAAMRRDSYSRTPPAGRHLVQAEVPLKKEEKGSFKVSHALLSREERNGPKTVMHLAGIPGKSTSSMSLGQKISAPITASSVKAPQVHTSSSASLNVKAVTPKSPKLPMSLKISQPKSTMEERERPNGNEAGFTPVQFTSSADSESYLTIPVKPAAKQLASSIDKTTVYTFPSPGSKTQTVSPPAHVAHSGDAKQHESHQSPKRSSIVMETRPLDTPTATIYHHPLPLTMQAATPHVICFSPTVQPSPVPTEHFQTTQRKMLLDPTTGSYYLVDTPVQPATRRLFDPETGQYVDVPMPQQPPMTPVPMPISPLALSPGAYGHTYMFYPGYMPTTVIPARIQSQLSVQSEVDTGDKGHAAQLGDGAYMEGPYYMPSEKSLQTPPGVQNASSSRVASGKQPVISITSQQGPRIIAPPSFDGTTMSFVVEHR
ncbi:uncharacterized protein C4orf54 homolog [Pygocentrus nattereri]|uniref:uncharacterized protein C4orf54 homolog n=1 Tax=Pygocentrus nattereri TaxID=42514 RepID=UPI000EA7CF32|nr:uncharacterized protein C4orf54 homolog [Pygocentrus nattereri]